MVDVVTEDGYVLSMYRIRHSTLYDDTMGPIMWMHGAGMNPTDWIQGFSEDPPMIQQAALGHPVYMLSQRGNSDSLNHTSLDYTVDFEDYFDFGLDEFAIDQKDAAAAMLNDAGNIKGWYFGYSQGTSQMMAAVATYQSEMAAAYNRIIMLAPCFGTYSDDTFDPSTLDPTKQPDYIYGNLTGQGIWKSGGSNWEDETATICANLDQDLCDWASAMDSEIPQSIKLGDHWNQMTWNNSFQSYVSDWVDPTNIAGTAYDMAYLDLLSVSMYVGENDAPCPPSEALKHVEIIPSMANYVTLLGEDHGVFGYYSGQDYMELLNAELVVDTSIGDDYNASSVTLATENDDKEEDYDDYDKDDTSDDKDDDSTPDFGRALSTQAYIAIFFVLVHFLFHK